VHAILSLGGRGGVIESKKKRPVSKFNKKTVLRNQKFCGLSLKVIFEGIGKKVLKDGVIRGSKGTEATKNPEIVES